MITCEQMILEGTSSPVLNRDEVKKLMRRYGELILLEAETRGLIITSEEIHKKVLQLQAEII